MIRVVSILATRRLMTDFRKPKSSLSHLLRLILPAVCFAAAIWSAAYARWDLRASAAEAALARVTAGVTEAAQSVAIAHAAEILLERHATSKLHDLAARLALAQRPVDLDAARRETHAELRRSPAQGDSWARLAFIDVVETGRLGSTGRDALQRSFLVGPFGNISFQRWRVEFALGFWHDLNDELRASARWNLRARDRYWLQRLVARLEARGVGGDAIKAVEEALDLQ